MEDERAKRVPALPGPVALASPMKYLLWSLIVGFVIAAIGVSGVQSLNAATVFLWMAFVLYALFFAALGIREIPKRDGGKAALITLLLVGVVFGGWQARSWLVGWLTKHKAPQIAAQQIAPAPAPKAPTEVLPTPRPQSVPAPKGLPGGPHVGIRQGGKGNTANPGTNTGPVNQGNCGVVQLGGSNNTASPNCAPPPVTLSYRILPPAQAINFEPTPGLIKTEIEITPDQAVSAPFQISMDFSNPVVGISNMVKGVNVTELGGDQSVGTHAMTTVHTGIGPSNPLVVVVTSHVPVIVISPPQIKH
jgi:hypothetical protein